MFFKSRFVRLAIVMALCPTLTMVLLSYVTYGRMHEKLTSEYDLRLNNEISQLSEVFAFQGLDALLNSVNLRLKMRAEEVDPFDYGVLVSGKNLSEGKQNSSHSQIGFFELDNQRIRISPLSKDIDLILAVNTDNRSESLQRLLLDMISAIAFSLVSGLIIGTLAAQYFARRIKKLNCLIDEVSLGNVNARLNTDDANDEISFLSERINTMLDRIALLIQLRKQTCDQVAHELRTPLSQLRLSLENMPIEKSNQGQLALLQGDLSACVKLLDGLLDVSALESQSGDKRSFDYQCLSSSVQSMVNFYRALAEEKHLAIAESYDSSSYIHADFSQIKRLIANLLDNAIKYSPDGGKISIRTHNTKEYVHLIIKDQGDGIDEENIDNIFQPFIRQTKQDKIKGHGLGLSIVRAIVHRHDGIILARNNKNDKGSCFEVKFKKATI